MTAFWIVWAGQLISLLGSAMTQFAITIWAFEATGKATALALIGVFFTIPLLVMSPVVGVLVDRYDRKLMMMLSDLSAGATTVGIFILYVTGALEIWHVYVSAIINGVFQGFQWPAYSAALSVMIPKDDYVRANSMLEIVGPGANIVAPITGGALLGMGAIGGFDGFATIMIIDMVSAVAAVGSLLIIYIPQPERSTAGAEAAGGFFKEAIYGFKYILERPPLLAIQSVFMLCNMIINTAGWTLLAPMLLARTGSNAWIYGASETIASIAMVVSGVIVGTWGGFKRRVHGVLLGWATTFIGFLIVGFGRPEPPLMMAVWAVGLSLGAGVSPLIDSSNQAIWMAKVAPDVQGRVFSARRLIAWFAAPIGALIGGTVADYVMEPAMREGGALAGTFGVWVGIGSGAGMSLMFILTGVIGLALSLGSYLVPIVRNVEDILPDHDVKIAADVPERAEAGVKAAPA